MAGLTVSDHTGSETLSFFLLSTLRNLHDHGTGKDDIIGELAVQRASAGKIDVGDAGQVLRDNAAGSCVELGEGGGQTRGESAVGGGASGFALELDG